MTIAATNIEPASSWKGNSGTCVLEDVDELEEETELDVVEVDVVSDVVGVLWLEDVVATDVVLLELLELVEVVVEVVEDVLLVVVATGV